MIFGHILSICAMMLLLRPTLRASRITSDIFGTASTISIESDLETQEEDDSEVETEDETLEDTLEDDVENDVDDIEEQTNTDSDVELVG